MTDSISLKQIEQVMKEQEVREIKQKIRTMIALSFSSEGFSFYQVSLAK